MKTLVSTIDHNISWNVPRGQFNSELSGTDNSYESLVEVTRRGYGWLVDRQYLPANHERAVIMEKKNPMGRLQDLNQHRTVY